LENDAVGVVTKLVDDGYDIVLSVDHWTRLGLVSQGYFIPNPRLITLRELLGAAGDDQRLTIETVGGQRQALIAAARSNAGRGVWTVLVPSGLAPTT
jgi:hypothetical protein